MATLDRNLTKFYRGGRFSTREGMILEIPPSGFDWGSMIPSVIDPYEESSSQQFPLGTKLIYGDRIYRYALCGGTGVEIGALVQSLVPLAGHIAETGSVAGSVGDTTITFTPAVETTDDLVANELQDGYIYVYDGTGEGGHYKIRSHPAIVGAVAGVITLIDPVKVAFAAASVLTVTHNPYYKFLIHPSPPTATPVGFTVMAVTANYYCWLLTQGPGACLVDGTIVMGQEARPSEDDDGAVAAQDYDEADDANIGTVGRVMQIGADAAGGAATYGQIWANLE